MRVLLLCCSLFFSLAYAIHSPLKTEYEWKYFDYLWQTPTQKHWFVRSNQYDHRNLTPIDVDRSQDGRTFVTIIRQPGVPASVHTVSNQMGESGPLLVPYPDWSWYDRQKGCSGIINVYRVAIDSCNRIWLLDTGRLGFDPICPPKLMVFDLSTNKLIMTKDIPSNMVNVDKGNSLLVTPIVETYGPRCEHTTVYMADVTGFAMVMWNHHYGFRRLEANEFKGDRSKANFTISGESFFLPDGLLGMALSPIPPPGGERILAFRPLASRSIYAAPVESLREGKRIDYYRGQNVLPSQASVMAFSSGGTLLYGLTGQTGIGCWHMSQPWTHDSFKTALTDRERLQFISGMKVIGHNQEQESVIMMSNRLQKIYSGTMDFNDINFRVTIAQVNDIIKDTTCSGELQDHNRGNKYDRPHGNPSEGPYGYPHDRPHGNPSKGPYGYPHGRPHDNPSEGPYGYPHDRPHGNPSKGPYGYPHDRPHGNPSKGPYGYPHDRPHGNPSKGPYGYPHDRRHGNHSKGPYGYPHDRPHGHPGNFPHRYPYGHPH